MSKLTLKLGDGLKINAESKLSVATNGDHISIDEHGVFVDNLNGADAPEGGTEPDGWTIVKGPGANLADPGNPLDSNSFIDINRDVVNLIYTFGLYKPTMRHPTTIDYSTAVKDVRSICNEFVAGRYYDSQRGGVTYIPRKGEMIQLVTGPHLRLSPFGSGTIAVESGNRFGDDVMETKVILVINEVLFMSDISPTGATYWVYSMKLRCIYSTVPEYVVGNLYTGTQYIDGTNYI
jgi:hypothetical protein